MSESSICKSAFKEEPVPKKQKLGDETPAPPLSSGALVRSSFGYGSAGVKSHMEDAHVMFDECVQTSTPPPSHCP